MKYKTKGNLLEDIVADLHKYPDVTIKKNAHIKPTTGEGNSREFDVLLYKNVAGYDVCIPIECKNWPNKKIGSPLIDSFFGKLQSVGLPPSLAVFITTGRFTKGAINRANQAGIKLLTFDGLNSDGLAPSILNVLENFCFQGCEIKGITFEFLPGINEILDGNLNLYNSEDQFICNVIDLIWNSWIKGFPGNKIGEYTLNFGKDIGFKTMTKAGEFVKINNIEIKIFVYRYVISKTINAKLFMLIKPNGDPFKVQLKKVGENSINPLPIYRFEDEEQLKQFENMQGGIKLKWDIRLNRITMGTMYWPPSKEYAEKVEKMSNTADIGSFIVKEPKDIISSMGDQLDPKWIKFYEESLKISDPHYCDSSM